MTQWEQPQKQNGQEIKELHPFERWLIIKLRTKYRFGEVVIITQNGLPMRIKQAVLGESPTDKDT